MKSVRPSVLARLILCLVPRVHPFQFQTSRFLVRRLPSPPRCFPSLPEVVRPPPPTLLRSHTLSASKLDEAPFSSVDAPKNPSPSRVNMAIKAVGSTTTVVVSVTFFVVLAWKRDALMISFFIGSIANGILSKVLKKLINQTRPPELEHADDIHLKPGDKGMPSSHAMSLGFIATFIACNQPWTQIPLAVYAVVSLVYRVQVKLHTWQQVLVGSIVGSGNGFAWFRLCTGGNPWRVNLMRSVTTHLLNENGQLPLPMMIVPLLVGAVTIGSFERRVSSWLNRVKEE